MKLAKFLLTPPIAAISVLLSVTLGAQGEARTFWVATNGVDSVSGLDPAVPTTFTNALAQAGDGDTVKVTEGTYVVPVSRQRTASDGKTDPYSTPAYYLTNAVTVVGVGGADKVIFDGENANNRYAFWLNNAKARLEGVTVQRIKTKVRYEWEESPMIELRNGTVVDCVVKDCSVYYVGGIDVRTGSVIGCRFSNLTTTDSNSRAAGINKNFAGTTVISNCVFENCKACRGAAIYATQAVNIYGCVIRNCQTPASSRGNSGALTLSHDNAVAVNCVITNNTGATGAGVTLTKGVLRNSLIADNVQNYEASGAGGGVNMSGGTLDSCTVVGNSSVRNQGHGVYQTKGTVVSCIINCNATDKAVNDSNNHTRTDGTVTCTCTYPEMSGEGNLARDPRFVSVAGCDYNLADASPCFDCGKPAAWMEGAVDVYGHPRILNDIVNMGAIETPTPAVRPLTVSIAASARQVPAPYTVRFTAAVDNPPADTPAYSWDFGDGETSTEASPEHVYRTFGVFTVSVVVTFGEREARATEPGLITVGSDTAWVSEGSGTWPFDTVEKGTNDVKTALGGLCEDPAYATDPAGARRTYLHVDAGTWTVPAVVELAKRKLTVTGEPGAVFVGAKDVKLPYGAFVVNGPDILVEGLVMSNLVAHNSANVAYGCAITLEQGVVSNCTLTHCSLPNGSYINGSVRITGNGTFTHGRIVGCTADDGGAGGGGRAAALVVGGGTLAHTVITNCTGSCAVVELGSGTVTNCQVVGNKVGPSGSSVKSVVYLSSASARLVNARVVGNQSTVADASAGVCVEKGGASLRNVLIADNSGPGYAGFATISTQAGVTEAPWALENVTIAGNRTTSQTHPVFYSINTKACQLVNTIIAANEATAEPAWGDATVVDHSWTSGDPKFIRTAGKRAYHLGMDSRCRDTGTSEGRAWMIGTKDLDGKDRIIGGEVDIGCFEYDPTGLMLLVR